MNNLPNGWKDYCFGDVVQLSKHKYNPKKEIVNYPCVELEHISQETGKILGNTSSKKLASVKNRFSKGDVLFGKLRPYLKKFAMPNFEGVCSTEIWVFKTTENILNSYLYQYVQTNNFISEANKSTGSKMPRADWSVISELIFSLPPLPEQQKIAEVLNTWDKAINTTEKLLINSEQQKKALMQQLLTGKKRLKDFSRDWKAKELKNLIKHYGGTALEKFVSETANYHFISIGNYSIDGKYIDKNQRIEFNEKTKKKLLNKNELVMVLNDKTKTGDIIGSTILIDEDNKYIYNQRSERIIPNNELIPKFFWYLLNSIPIRQEVFSRSQGGTQIYVNFNSLISLKLKIPPLEEQQAIAQVLTTADQQINNLKQQISKLKQEKKALMQVLLSGKVRVNVPYND